ncbi:RICIN domain-containing protein [Nonomuraea sp. NPDC050556]|uniref:RICIN domain-containing protein n=1 Tax=Nonomuraea sp. NPDC050556 TaxID=3364369 RepID=UPI0037942A7A
MVSRYFLLRDQLHKRCVVAGEKFGKGYVYHQDEKADHHEQPTDLTSPVGPPVRDVAQWRFEPATDDYFYLVDRRHRAALSAGDGLTIRHIMKYAGNKAAQWKPEPTDEPGVFRFVNRRYPNDALMGGDNEVGDLYHQPPGHRTSGRWAVEMVSDGEGGPPGFIVSQKLESLTFDTAKAPKWSQVPVLVINRVRLRSEGAEQQFVLKSERSRKSTETISTDHRLTLGVLVSVSMSVGKADVANYKMTEEIEFEYGFARNNTTSTVKTTTTGLTAPVRAGSGRPVYLSGTLSEGQRDVGFTAKVTTTYATPPAAAQKAPATVTGTWTQVGYLTGHLTFSH